MLVVSCACLVSTIAQVGADKYPVFVLAACWTPHTTTKVDIHCQLWRDVNLGEEGRERDVKLGEERRERDGSIMVSKEREREDMGGRRGERERKWEKEE